MSDLRTNDLPNWFNEFNPGYEKLARLYRDDPLVHALILTSGGMTELETMRSIVFHVAAQNHRLLKMILKMQERGIPCLKPE